MFESVFNFEHSRVTLKAWHVLFADAFVFCLIGHELYADREAGLYLVNLWDLSQVFKLLILFLHEDLSVQEFVLVPQVRVVIGQVLHTDINLQG